MSVLDAYAAQTGTAQPQAAPTTPVVTVFDHANQVAVNLPESDLETALASGQYTLPKNHEVNVISPDGTAGTVPSENIYDAIKSGYSIENSADKHTRETEAKYGDKTLEATAQGAARGLSFGLSDLAQTKTGFRTPEQLEGLKEANPISSTIGEIGGTAAGLLLPIGPAGVGVRAVSKAGQIVERGLATQLAKAGVKGTVAKALVEKILPTAVGSAAEGAFYGGGQLLSENALGKADFNAENLVGYLGTGALIGGSAAGALKGTGMLLEPVVQKIAPMAEGAVNKFTNKFINKEHAATELTGYNPSQAAKLRERNPTLVNELPDFLKEKVGLKATDTADQLTQKVESVRQAAGSTIDSVLKTIDETGLNADRKIFSDISDKIEQTVIKPYAETPGFETAINKATKYANDVKELANKTTPLNASDLQKFRQQTDELINFGKRTDELPMLQEAAYVARTGMRNEITNLASKVDPALRDKLLAANRDYHIASEILPNMHKKAENSNFVSLKDAILGAGAAAAGPVGSTIAAGLKFAESDLRRKLVILSNIENAQQKVFGTMKKAVNGFFEGTKKLNLIPTQILLKSQLSSNLDSGKPKAPATKQAAWTNIQNNLQKYAQNPEALMQRTNRVTAALYGGAPETSGAVDATVSNAVQFLSSKLPKRSTSTGLFDMLKEPSMPSNYEISKFERYLQAVEEPTSVLHDLQDGTATHEGIEALQAVYPSLYDSVRNIAIEKISTQKHELSYQKKIQLGSLLNIPADESLLPQNILGLQSNFSAAPTQSQGAVKSTQGGVEKLNIAERNATSLQKPDELS